MMLQALHALSERLGLVEDPAYEKRPVDFVVRLDGQGRLLALEPTQDDRGRGIDAVIPRLPKRTVAIVPGFLVDNAKYALGLLAEEKGGPPAAEKHQRAFRELVAEANAAHPSKDLGALLAFLDPGSAGRKRLLSERPLEEWTGSEMIVFVVGSGLDRVHETEQARRFWAERNATAEGEGRVRCLVTGQLEPSARLHPPVKLKLEAALQGGASLVSFNADAFRSHGLEQGENAQISTRAAVGYVTALNELLAPTKTRRFRSGVGLDPNTVTVFWTREANPTPDLFLSLLDPPSDAGELLFDSVFRGLAPGPGDETAFYAVTLSANASRVVVRDWLETSAAEAKRHLRAYFEDLRIGNAADRPLPLWKLVSALESPGGKGVSPAASARLVEAAFRGRPFPREILGAALRRLRLPTSGDGAELHLLHQRVALIKATLIRLPTSPQKGLTVSLDPENSQRPYLLGRLFAILERLQGAALGDVNASIRDRYFGAASTRPALTFPRLLQLSIHHSAKAEHGGWLEKLKGEVLSGLPAERFPTLLGLEDQGLFAVGYYHQREEFFRKRPAPEVPSEAPQA